MKNKRKITKRVFEKELYKKYGKIYVDKHQTTDGNTDPDNPKVQTLSLYYSDEDATKHIATWANGEGWEFS